ncbi:unnamed protein product [Mytilus edulis]|uniref:Uncharacterized protein n=1 Tax=Mytilus edulis TaxID=6550 RepID=A0A8S3REN3_MYTED|nr:unnamed protein product [Mytilus edulis]
MHQNFFRLKYKVGKYKDLYEEERNINFLDNYGSSHYHLLCAFSTLLNITCPYAHNWYLTASVKCHSVANYTCLYDSVNKNYKQNCKGPSKSHQTLENPLNLKYRLPLKEKFNRQLYFISDYKCVPQNERSFTCTEITHFKTGNESEGIDVSNFEENGNVINVEIVVGLKDVTCFEHEDAIFTCEVTKEATGVKCVLQKELKKRSPEINDLKAEKHINFDDIDLLYPKTDIFGKVTAPKSANRKFIVGEKLKYKKENFSYKLHSSPIYNGGEWRVTIVDSTLRPYNSSLAVTLKLTSRNFNQYKDLSGKLEKAIKLKACPFTDVALRSFEFVKSEYWILSIRQTKLFLNY